MSNADYRYKSAHGAHTQAYLMPSVQASLKHHSLERRIFELGCGNGANALELTRLGCEVVGVDPSDTGARIAGERGLDMHQGSSEEDLAAKYGTFPILISLEVVEHVFSPRQFAQRVFDLLEPGGLAIISTPYHAYLKNLALAVSGKMDTHFTALWEGGHIKFFSHQTMTSLFKRVGMEEVDFKRVGRIPPLAKSMIGVYRKAG